MTKSRVEVNALRNWETKNAVWFKIDNQKISGQIVVKKNKEMPQRVMISLLGKEGEDGE